MRCRSSKASSSCFLLGSGREPRGQLLTPHDPVELLAQEGRDGSRCEVILAGKRVDDTSLVEHRERTRRRVGQEHPPLLHGRDRRGFHDHRHPRVSQVAPAGEALEAVEYLVGAVRGGHDPQRNLLQLYRVGNGPLSRAQSCQARAESFDVHPANRPGRLSSCHGLALAGLHAALDRLTCSRHGRAPRGRAWRRAPHRCHQRAPPREPRRFDTPGSGA